MSSESLRRTRRSKLCELSEHHEHCCEDGADQAGLQRSENLTLPAGHCFRGSRSSCDLRWEFHKALTAYHTVSMTQRPATAVNTPSARL
jgi:hypothetical protein